MRKILLFSLFLMVGVSTLSSCDKLIRKFKARSLKVGDKVDSLNGVYVYYNNSVGNVEGRNVAPDGYNIGLRYQCVEFVKRYYYEHLDHKMPDSYGHAKDFFEKQLADGKRSKRRNLTQYSNPSSSKPKVDDLVVYDATSFNKYGHVAIISKVGENSVEIVQQNPGPMASSRETYRLKMENGKWKIEQNKILGWLRKG
ncbi:CHAP domain-containing protein [Aequorivita sp. H23M31]|uniref:CHAP domain-containing protein n=1 Tax=Aequorivita ciconiae TaxID=2494375 RepID=A0A410G719_9FLAO|nr:CHAP domain-containing protein [Aequorivita sp. H23M31]QAA83073.1 CHAP domain-containing protein [Aequorivita sp. H23M31]